MLPTVLTESETILDENAISDIGEKTTGAVEGFLQSLGLGAASSVLSAILVFVLCLVVVKVLSHLTDKLLTHTNFGSELVRRFLKTAIKIVLWAIAIVIIAGSLGIPTASLVAVISIAGLALSLSMQNILSNLFSGVTLLITRPFDVGDFVSIGSNSGSVHSIGLFYTTITTPDKRIVTLPNSDVASDAVTNYSREPLRRLSFQFGTEYSDSTESAMTALREAIANCDLIVSEPEPILYISDFKDSYIEYTALVWVKNADYWPVTFQFNELVRKSFDRNNVHMSYNHLNVHMVP